MKTIIRFILGACLAAGSFALALRATEPAPAKGRVLLLENERILEGDIEREGNRYLIRRDLGDGSVPANQVMRLCADRQDAFRCLRGRANLLDIDERMRLARWCQLHGLNDEGAAEVRAALEIKPDCAAAKRLLCCFERATEPRTPEPPIPAMTPRPTAVSTNADLSLEAATLFTTRVQPILMNACVSCHSSDGGGSFKLMPTFENGALNTRATQHNLAAAVAQINRTSPSASPLLVKSVSLHGPMTHPPLRGAQMSAFNSLEEWVQKVAANLPETPALTSPTPTRPNAEPVPSSTLESRETKRPEPTPTSRAVDNQEPTIPGTTSLRMPSQFAQPAEVARVDHEKSDKEPALREVSHTSSTTPPPKPAAEPVDPFDPLIFNRESHPERTVAPPAAEAAKR